MEPGQVRTEDEARDDDRNEPSYRPADMYQGDSEETARLRRSTLRKLDIHVLPPLALLWLANFIDRSNVGNARIAGLTTSLHLEGTQFNTALAIFYVFYIISEIPSNLVLKRMRPNFWLPLIVTAWGLVTTLSGIVQNYAGLLVIRSVLGFCEGGLLPGMVLYLSTLYRRHELQLRIGIFYSAASLSGAFGGLLATGLEQMDGLGNLAGWRWIFIVEGIATVLIGIGTSLVMPESVKKAKFLTEEERAWALHALSKDMAAARRGLPIPKGDATDGIASAVVLEDEKSSEARIEHADGGNRNTEKGTPGTDTYVNPPATVTHHDEGIEWLEVRRGIFDIQTWLTGIGYLCLCCSLYSYSLFLPTIITGMGYKGTHAQLFTVPPYVPAAVATVAIAVLADRLKWRGPLILFLLPISIAGYIILVVTNSNRARYAGVFLVALGIYPAAPCILSILPNNHAGHYKRATSTALQLMIANCAGFVATFAYRQTDAPAYRQGHAIVLGCLCLGWLAFFLNVVYCIWENRARREGRREGNVERYDELVSRGKTKAPIGDRSPGFFYTL